MDVNAIFTAILTDWMIVCGKCWDEYRFSRSSALYEIFFMKQSLLTNKEEKPVISEGEVERDKRQMRSILDRHKYSFVCNKFRQIRD